MPPRGVRKNHNKEHIDRLLKDLYTMTVVSQADMRGRDSIMVALHQAGASYRKIAAATDMSYAKVREIVLHGKTQDVPNGGFDWLHANPDKVIAHLAVLYADAPPATDDEIRQALYDMDHMNLPDPQAPPQWVWSMVRLRAKLNHALHARRTLDPETLAEVYRVGVLSKQYRLATYGTDTLAELRARCLTVLGTLCVEALNRERQGS